MAYWGVAYATGPFYNYPWRHFGTDELATRAQLCHDNIELAQQAASEPGAATDAERSLIAALRKRFPTPAFASLEGCDSSDDAYRDAMREVHELFPTDHDVMALFVEALITRTPWRLWDVSTGQPARGADTTEALAVCDRSIALSANAGVPAHPGILHMHIHTCEMSPHPELAMNSADQLCDLGFDNGHLNHMPGHIYVLCGEYEKARRASTLAIAADDKYVAYTGSVQLLHNQPMP